MFDNNNDQQGTTDSGMSHSAPMPDPINGNSFDSGAITPDPSFSPPNPVVSSAPTLQELSTPELPSSGTPDPAPSSEDSDTGSSSTNGDDLLDLKQQALQQLSPLVSHLDQTAEEKFRTTMMMIQASDDQGLIKTAFEAAKQISDDKARAQALLDIINEINYFTQHSGN